MKFEDDDEIQQEIKNLKKKVKALPSSQVGHSRPSKQTRKKRSKTREYEGDETVDGAFLTQFPQHGLAGDYNHADLRVNLPNNQEKSKATLLKEQKLSKALNFLGIKETYMIDHLDPNFQRALEEKTQSKIKDLKLMKPTYEEQGVLSAPVKEEPQRHYYIEKYSSRNPTGQKLVPMSRTIARVGSQGALVHVEKSQYPNHPNDKPKRLKVSKFQDDELQLMCGRKFESELKEWKMI